MIRRYSLLSTCVAVALVGVLQAQAPVPAPAAPPALATADEIRTFADSLEACKAGKAATAHPLMRSFVIEHTVTGEKDAACMYSQTMPGKMTMECAFSPKGRALMATEIRASAAGGPMRGGTSQAQPEWAKECELVTASGARSPMVRVK
jgi:hypothetical protein